MGRREILQTMHHLSVYFIMKWHFPQDNQWKYCFMVVLWDDYETNLNFIFVWTTEWKITWKYHNFLVRNRPIVEYQETCNNISTVAPITIGFYNIAPAIKSYSLAWIVLVKEIYIRHDLLPNLECDHFTQQFSSKFKSLHGRSFWLQMQKKKSQKCSNDNLTESGLFSSVGKFFTFWKRNNKKSNYLTEGELYFQR